MMGSVSGTLATMGCAVPYAIAAKFAHPDRPAIALVGDGAMQMNGMGELITDCEILAALGAIRGWSSWCSTTAIWLMSRGKSASSSAIRNGRHRRICPMSVMRISRDRSGLAAAGSMIPEQIGAAWDEALRGGPALRPRHGDGSRRCRRCRLTSRSSRPGISPAQCCAENRRPDACSPTPSANSPQGL